jgi:hypothetical protein
MLRILSAYRGFCQILADCTSAIVIAAQSNVRCGIRNDCSVGRIAVTQNTLASDDQSISVDD